MTLRDLNPSTARWVQRVFQGIERYFYLPEEFEMAWVRRVNQWKLFDIQRRRFELKHGAILAKNLKRIGEAVAERWASRSIELTIAETRRLCVPMFTEWVNETYRDTELYFVARAQNSLREGKAFDVIDPFSIPELTTWTQFVTASKIVRLDEITRGLVNALLVRIINENLSVFDAQKLLQDSFPFSKTRAYRIARTEVISAANAATHYGIQAGVGPSVSLTKSWLSTNDRRTRPTHVVAGASQKDVPYEKPFEVGGSKLMFPGDGSLGAAAKEVIQCRCTALYFMPPLTRSRR